MLHRAGLIALDHGMSRVPKGWWPAHQQSLAPAKDREALGTMNPIAKISTSLTLHLVTVARRHGEPKDRRPPVVRALSLGRFFAPGSRIELCSAILDRTMQN